MHHTSKDMQKCIDECLKCYQACLGTATNQCLETGGKHVEPKHLRLMLACAEICRTCAHLLLMNSDHAKHVCAECVDICEACAKSCEAIGGMQPCVDACRKCAESCRKLAALPVAA